MIGINIEKQMPILNRLKRGDFIAVTDFRVLLANPTTGETKDVSRYDFEVLELAAMIYKVKTTQGVQFYEATDFGKKY